MTIEEQISVMTAYKAGKPIQFRLKNDNNNIWINSDSPVWNWSQYEYRIKLENKLRPYKNPEEFIKDLKQKLYIKTNNNEYISVLTINDDGIVLSDNTFMIYDELIDYKWSDDTPCGIIEDE